MIRRSTWILVLLFGIVFGIAWLIQNNQSKKPESIPTVTPTSSLTDLYNLAGKQVVDITISNSSGNEIGLYRDTTSTQWAVRDVAVEKADTFQIDSITAQLFSLQAKETLTQTPPLDAIGLATPAYTITLMTSDGAQLITYVGSKVPTGNGYYVRIDSGLISIVDNVVMDDILNMLAHPPILSTPTPEVTPTDTGSPTESGITATPTP